MNVYLTDENYTFWQSLPVRTRSQYVNEAIQKARKDEQADKTAKS